METIEIGGIEIAYWDHGGAGDCTPIVLSHSLFFDHTMFDELGRLYLDHGFRVLTYDHPGQGASADATTDQLSVDGLASVAAGLITHLGVGPVHFLGNSLGGMVAVRLAARRPELLRSAVAVCASAESEHKVREYAPLGAHVAAYGAAARADAIAHIMFGDDTLAADSETTQAWHRHISLLPRRIGPAIKGVIYRSDMVAELELERAIQREQGARVVPVLAIAGDQDHAYPPPISGANIAAATGGSTVTIAGVGHSASLEAPKAVFEETVPFFAAIDQVA